MTDGHAFDQPYWEQHWDRRSGLTDTPPNPYLARELDGLTPGSALDAGCGAGAEAVWLAERGWRVTAVDISVEALALAGGRAAAGHVRWVQADLTSWQPEGQFDLVTTSYAHPAMPQLEFYDRIAEWVASGGTLLIVGHLHDAGPHGHGHGHADGPPAEASATAAAVVSRLDDAAWEVVTADERHRTVAGREARLHDVVVRAVRRG